MFLYYIYIDTKSVNKIPEISIFGELNICCRIFRLHQLFISENILNFSYLSEEFPTEIANILQIKIAVILKMEIIR